MTEHSNQDRFAALRLFDAAANRGGEASRMLEDIVRFARDDAFLTAAWKQLRHELSGIIAELPASAKVAARDTTADVGTHITTEQETLRANFSELVVANCERLKQSLRTLEETAKLLSSQAMLPDIAAKRLETLRYRAYTLEKATLLGYHASARFAESRLGWLTDGRMPEGQIAEVLRSGIDLVQLRAKHATDRELLSLANTIRKISQQTGTPFIVNDRPDLAVLCGAEGVHVGQEDLSVSDARRIVGPKAIVGVSTHSIDQARQAVLDGASYLGVGPTFPSGTKQFDHFPGLELIERIAAEIQLPWFAIGGIGLENLPQVISAGAKRIAVSGAIAGENAAASAQVLKKLLNDV